MELIGKTLANRYEILEEIGTGGMAMVYKARCNLLNRFVAIKVLKSEYAKDELFVKRFKAEAQSAASLTHPNIVSVYDVGQEDGINYIVMELLESKTLKDYIDEHGALGNEMVIKISIQVASALEAAHKAHIIHRDIKPHNIVLNKNMVAKVTDFGIAKVSTTATITNFGTTMGSVHYFSPEHAKGGYTDERSDIYSLGVVMYEMSTGKLPFDADSPVSVALKHIQEEPVPPNVVNSKVSGALNQIILKSMAKNTADRYKSATELLDDLYIALKDPDKSTLKQPSSVEAGATQVIPIIAMKDIDNNRVPNIRTKQPRRMTFVNSKEKEIVEDLKPEEQQTTDKVEDKKEVTKKKIAKIYVISAIALIVILLTVFGIIIANKLNGKPPVVETIEAPNVVGRKFTEAVEEYAKQGITVQQDKLEYDAVQPEGYIVSQTPEKGDPTTDKKIYVIVSKGQKLVTVPDVTTKDYKVAKYELETTLGFVMEMEEEVSTTVAQGLIISQDPKKDEQKPYGSTIKVKVSKGDGKAKVLMPKVLGKTEADAKKTLQDLKLSVTVEEGEDATKANGVIISQSYPENQELKEGDLVKITVNKVLVTKTVTLNLLELQGGNLPEDETATIEVTVTASIDGGAANTVYDKPLPATQATATFNIKGYKNANLQIYINGSKVKDQVVNFN